MSGPFATYAPVLRQLGYWPRPVVPGTKKPAMKNWQTPDPELPSGVLERWLRDFADHGIGIVTGSPFLDGTMLGAIDIDQDEYVPVTSALLRNPVCGRRGNRGIVFFVRVRGLGKYRPFKTKAHGAAGGKVGEFLCDRRFCVLPPTIHPTTERPYEWVGKSLDQITCVDLPIVEA